MIGNILYLLLLSNIILIISCRGYTPTSEKTCQNGKALILASLAFAENSNDPKDRITFADAFILERLRCEDRFKE